MIQTISISEMNEIQQKPVVFMVSISAIHYEFK